MADETKPKTPTAPAKGVKPKLVRVSAIKPSELPTEGQDGPKFTIKVVTMNFKQEDWACTKEVYKWVQATQPAFKVHNEWVCQIDPTTSLVTRITETPKPNTMPGFTKTDDGKEPSKHVVVSLFPDGSNAVTHIPERVTESQVAEIVEAVTSAEEELHTGQKVGRFIVARRSEEPGSTDIHVDPMPRQ